MWDDIDDISATPPHGSLTICASNPVSVANATESREQERKSSAPAIPPTRQRPMLSSSSKKNFLDGFKIRGNLRPRTKSDDYGNDVATTSSSAFIGGTSSTTASTRDSRNSSATLDDAVVAAEGTTSTFLQDEIGVGSVTKVLVDYRPVNDDEVVVYRGATVQVREVTPNRGYLVVTQSGHEGWVPGYVLNLMTDSIKKTTSTSWTFKNRFRKQQSCGTLKGESSRNTTMVVTANCGDTAVLRCRRRISSTATAAGTSVRWMAPNGHLINSGRKYSFGADDLDTAFLHIADCDLKDSGEYTCVQTDNIAATVSLEVKARSPGDPQPPPPPRVDDLRGTTAIVSWDQSEQPASCSYTVECCRITDCSSKSWTVVNKNMADEVCVVRDLLPGETYSFRVLADNCREPSLPSIPLTVPPSFSPLSEMITVAVNNPLHKRNSFQDLDDCWQRDFERQFIELEELGRGRFSVVRR